MADMAGKPARCIAGDRVAVAGLFHCDSRDAQNSAAARTSLPLQSAIAAAIVSAAVAAVAEEAGFRGYMQQLFEARFAPAVAIAITSLVFALTHLGHGASSLPLMPLYFAAACIYGAVAYLTNSILPSLVLHFVGDAFLFSMPLFRIHFALPTSTRFREEFIASAVLGAVACVAISAQGFIKLTRMQSAKGN